MDACTDTAWDAAYQVTSLIDPAADPVSRGTARVQAGTRAEALTAATAWVHENDVYADPRIDPVVTIVTITPAAPDA